MTYRLPHPEFGAGVCYDPGPISALAQRAISDWASPRIMNSSNDAFWASTWNLIQYLHDIGAVTAAQFVLCLTGGSGAGA